MSANPISPFDGLFAQLSQRMSVAGFPVAHEQGTQADATATADERCVWIPADIEPVTRPFSLPDLVTPDDQAWDFLVSIYAGSLARAAQIHHDLVASLDYLLGPEQGAAPSTDATPAAVTGTANLAAWSYPSTDLDGLTLTFALPVPLTVTMPTGPLPSPVAVALAVGAAFRAALVPVLVTISRPDADGARYLVLELPADAASLDAPTFTLDPTAPWSACALLGFDATPVTGTAPSQPYRPGYKVGKSTRGPMGGTIDAGAWGLVVPVRLFVPIVSLAWIKAPIQSVSTQIFAATATGEDLAISNPAE